MSKLSGTRFDNEFATMMVAGHKKHISEYQREAKESDQVGSYAKETLPTLEKHLHTAESLVSSATTGKR
jgi:predicted outer membrane protein